MTKRLLILCLISLPALGVGVDRDILKDPKLEARARTLMNEIRCVVCQGQSIADSNAPIAAQMRALVREQISRGQSPSDVRAYLMVRYGDEILLRPRLTPKTYFLWGLPVILALLAVPIVARLRRPAPPPVLSKEEEARAQALLDEVRRSS